MTRSSASPLVAKKARLDRLRPLSPKTLEAVAAWVAYIDTLQAMQLRDDPSPYQRFMAERLEASLDHHLDMLERATRSSA